MGNYILDLLSAVVPGVLGNELCKDQVEDLDKEIDVEYPRLDVEPLEQVSDLIAPAPIDLNRSNSILCLIYHDKDVQVKWN